MRALVLLLAFSAAAAVEAQPVVTPTCPYSECAVRLEPGLLSRAIVRGPVGDGAVVGRIGFVLSDLPDVVADVPEARALAVRHRRQRIAGSLLVVAGTAVAWGAAVSRVSGDETLPDVGGLAGLGLVLGGSVVLMNAQRAESRAVWAYNRAFAE